MLLAVWGTSGVAGDYPVCNKVFDDRPGFSGCDQSLAALEEFVRTQWSWEYRVRDAYVTENRVSFTVQGRKDVNKTIPLDVLVRISQEYCGILKDVGQPVAIGISGDYEVKGMAVELSSNCNSWN